ncbi:MAG: DUF5018 domain-containing protein, partial [Eggerthellaceae bacterium]|nr:DUF5018 domain-containing protein [Eggerthellaceae bacterium]
MAAARSLAKGSQFTRFATQILRIFVRFTAEIIVRYYEIADGYGTFIMNGGTISGNTTGGDGGGIYIPSYDKLTVGASAIFSNNKAQAAYDRNPDFDAIYAAQISGTAWTSPFTQGFNNYDINHTEGEIFVPEDVVASSTKDITSFALAGVAASISGTNISVEVPYGTDLSSLVPTLAHNGVNISPAASAAQNFNAPVQYVVTAEDGTTKTYTVTATVSRQILEGNFGTWTGTGTRSTTIEVPLEKFVDLYFGTEKLVLDSDYSVAEGSTIITLNESF